MLRPAGYLDAVLAAGTIQGDNLILSEEAFQSLRQKYQLQQSYAEWPAWAKAIARLKAHPDVGVGDTIARVIGPVGGDAYKVWFKRLFGKSCGCHERQADLNRSYPYQPAVDESPSENGAV